MRRMKTGFAPLLACAARAYGDTLIPTGKVILEEFGLTPDAEGFRVAGALDLF